MAKPPLRSTGAYLAQLGQRVLLVDLDPQANATSSLGIDKQTVKNGTYEVLIGSANLSAQVLHNQKLKNIPATLVSILGWC